MRPFGFVPAQQPFVLHNLHQFQNGRVDVGTVAVEYFVNFPDSAGASLPKYAQNLYDAGRHSEVLMGAKFLVDSGMLDRGKTENVSKEAVFWGEKSLRALQDSGRFASADEIFQQLQDFNELLEPKSQFGGSTQGSPQDN